MRTTIISPTADTRGFRPSFLRITSSLHFLSRYYLRGPREAIKRVMCSAAVMVAMAAPVFCETAGPNMPHDEQLAQAYGFLLGQDMTLQRIEAEFPDQAIAAQAARHLFAASPLGASRGALEAKLSEILGQDWPLVKEQLSSQLRTTLDSQTLTEGDAAAFVSEVSGRVKGNLPDSVKAILLAENPTFSKSPAAELAGGWGQTFRTKGHPKAKGVDVSFTLPASWSRREAARPNIVQLFRSEAGHGLIVCNILVKDLGLPPDLAFGEDDVKESLQPDTLRQMVPPGGTFLDAAALVLDGSPAGMLIYDQPAEILDVSKTIRGIQFCTVQGRSMVVLQFLLDVPAGSSDTLASLQERYLPLARAVAATYVSHAKYQ